MRSSPRPRAKAKTTPRTYREYERYKADFLRDCSGSKPADYDAFIRAVGRKLGL